MSQTAEYVRKLAVIYQKFRLVGRELEELIDANTPALTFEVPDSPEEVIERRKDAARLIEELKAKVEAQTEMLSICRDIFIRCENAWHGGDEEPTLTDDVDALKRRLIRLLNPVSNDPIEF